jgi:hypothetical protein
MTAICCSASGSTSQVSHRSQRSQAVRSPLRRPDSLGENAKIWTLPVYSASVHAAETVCADSARRRFWTVSPHCWTRA